MNTDNFWNNFQIPYQEDDPSFQFVNPVAVSQHFIRVIGEQAFLLEQSERLTQQLANVSAQETKQLRRLATLRREVLSRHYGEITKSASSEIQDAFIVSKIRNDVELLDEFESIEDSLVELQDQRIIIQPRLDQLRARMKAIEKKMEWAKQYLDHEKLMVRVAQHG